MPGSLKAFFFFQNITNNTTSFYRSQFPIKRKNLITCDSTSSYFVHPLIPARVHKLLPSAKLIVVLRNPVERAYSEFNYTVTLGSELAENFEDLHRMGVKITIKGSVRKLDNKLRKKILDAVSKTENNNKISLIIAFDYGGRKEIVNAINKILSEDLLPNDINEAEFAKYLDSDGIPDPDLIIRTGGEYRLSNFLIWQSAYSEFYTSKVLWPDFGIMDLSEALIEYSKRIRRFGIQ